MALDARVATDSEAGDGMEAEERFLLGRPARPYCGAGSEGFAGARVLVTGGGGCIGSAIVEALLGRGVAAVVALDQAEGGLHDLETAHRGDRRLVTVVGSACDRAAVVAALGHDVTAVVHAAAHKHVPLMERQPHEAIRNNLGGLAVVARAAIEGGVRTLAFVSSDKAARPTSVLGRTKRVGERLCRALGDGAVRLVSVRLANVLDSPGSVLPLFRRQLASGAPLTITDPRASRYFMTRAEAADLVLLALRAAPGGTVVGPAAEASITVLDLAERLCIRTGTTLQVAGMEIIGARPGDAEEESIWAPGEIAVPFAGGPSEYIAAPPESRGFAARLTALIDRLDDLDESRVREELRSLAT